MKIQNSISLVFFAVFTFSCVQLNENLDTNEVTPSIPLSTSLPINSSTPTATFTPIMIPTLPNDEAGIALLKILSTNGNCKLPCLWGIIPIKSTFQEARTILTPFSVLSGSVFLDTPAHGSISPRYREGDLEIYTSIEFRTNPENTIVNHITFYAEAHKPLADGGYENVFDSSFFSEKVSAYMLSHVLSEQGVPESVLLSTSGGPLTRGGTGGFEIVLLYPNQGVFVHYTTQMYIIGKNVRGCLQNAHVKMDLFPMEDVDNFLFQIETATEWLYISDGFKPLEETTSMPVDEFYNIFSHPTDNCIETPANLWPIPEL